MQHAIGQYSPQTLLEDGMRGVAIKMIESVGSLLPNSLTERVVKSAAGMTPKGTMYV
jgi:hypothetical protein